MSESSSTAVAPGLPAALRRAAVARQVAAGLPSSRDEDWIYSDTKRLNEALTWPPAPAPAAPQNQSRMPFTPTLCFVDGAQSDPANGGGALTKAFETFLARQPIETLSGLDALHTAAHQDGAVLDLADSPALPLYLVLESATAGAASHVALFLRLAPRVKATLLCHHLSAPMRSGQHLIARIELAAGAELEWISLDEYPEGALRSRLEVTVAEDARFTSRTLSFSGAQVRREIEVELAAPRAKTALSGISLVHGDERVDQHTVVQHRAPDTESSSAYRALVEAAGQSGFTGRVIVARGADGTRAEQQNKNLLLAAGARALTRPQLQIDAKNISASHGATVGQLDENALFYLTSRGIGRNEAETLLRQAFAREILETIEHPGLRRALTARLLERLGASAELRQALEESLDEAASS